MGVDPKVLREYEQAQRQMVKQHSIPGFASAVLRHGKVVHTMAHGYADLETKQPFRMNTLCRLYCATKSYIATAFMTLVEEGKVSLEDRLDEFLPSFKNAKVLLKDTSKAVRPKEPIRMKHILSHTSGIGYPPDLGEPCEDVISKGLAKLQTGAKEGSIRSLREFVDRLAKVPLMHHPGTMYEYGFSMDVVGRVIEVIEGKDIAICLQDRVFGPLEMHDTLWHVGPAEADRFAAIYAGPNTWGNLYGHLKKKVPTTTAPGLLRIDGEDANHSGWYQSRRCPVKSGGGFMGYLAGGLVSTVEDTVKFVQFLASKGLAPCGRRLLSERTLVIMEKNRLKKSWGQGSACYIGNVGVFRDGGKEFGMGGAACTYWSVDRADGVATVWFAQNVDMKDAADMQGIRTDRADMWKAMYEAVRTGKKKLAKPEKGKRKAGGRSSGSTKRARSTKSA